jgi:hypothetical protein
MVVAFPGNKFKGEIVPALSDLIRSGNIRLIDLAFVMKDERGSVTSMEMEDLESDLGRILAGVQGDFGDLLNMHDLEAAAEVLEPNSSALLMVWEDVWATRLAEALRNADGVVLDLERVPHDIVQAAIDHADAQTARSRGA